MNTNLEQTIQNCTACEAEKLISSYITFKKPSTYYGSTNPKVMLIAHSPSVRTAEEADVVMKMDKPNQPLYKYVTENILQPLHLKVEDLYVTNLIKCKTTSPPEDINKSINFFAVTFSQCKTLFEEEVRTINPRLMLSLSETVLEILSKEYLGTELKMKDSFGKIHTLLINGNKYEYIPLVHIPKGDNSKVAKHYFPEQTERLKRYKIEVG